MKTKLFTYQNPRLELTIRAIGVFLLYSLIIFASSLFTFEPTSTPLFWPANAIVLCIMLYSTTQRAMIYLTAAFFGYYAYLIFYDHFGVIPSFLLSSANMVEILSGYLLLGYFASQPYHFNRLKKAIELIIYGIFLPSVVGATAGTFFMYKIWEAPTLINWLIWFGTGGIGYFVVLPLIISWINPQNKQYTCKDFIEITLIILFCFLTSFIIFGADKDTPIMYPYLLFPTLLLTCFRYDLRVTSIAFQVFILVSSTMSAYGHGPFAMGEYYREIVLLRFHLFCAITMITVLLVSALRNEREYLITELQEALGKIKTLKGFIPICSYCKNIRDDSGYWNQLEAYIHEHSDAELSHGICPTCAEKYYGKYFKSSSKSDKSNSTNSGAE